MLSILWALIPRRYLIAAAALVAVLLGGYAALRLYGSHREASGYKQGAAHVTDSVNAIAIKRLTVAETVYVHDAARTDSQVVKVSHGEPVQHLVIQTVPIPVQDTELKVRVIVTAFHDTVDNVPIRAAQYWQRADSVAGLALWSAHQWHAAYIASDSVAHLWRARALANIAPPSVSHAKRDVVYLTLGVIAGAVLHNQFHRTPNSVSTSRSVVIAAQHIR